MIRVSGDGRVLGVRRVLHRPDLAEPVPVPAPSAAPEPVMRPAPIMDEPTAAELVGNFGAAMARWAARGFPVVPEAVYGARAAACEACELWAADARMGLGKCMAPGCGCTKLKRWLATERCKHPDGDRWPA